ncbi:MAG: DMT family transporter [Candidatus Phosphoribacter sp.]|nr:DMT family transporter [Actinomycetales bacterium]
MSGATTAAERKLHLDARAVAIVIACTVIWGFGQLASKIALAQVPPFTQGGVRSLAAGVLVLGWARWRGVRLLERDGTLGPGLLAGMLFAAEFGAIYSALRFTTVGRMTVFLYLAPFVVALGMVFISRAERLSALAFSGLAAAFGGVSLAFVDGFTAAAIGPQQWVGDLLGVSAALGWGATTLVVRATRLAPVHPAKTLLYQLGVSAVVLLAIGAAVGEQVSWPLRVDVWVAMVFQIVVVGSTSYLVWFWLIRTYSATRLSAFTLLTPVVALVAGALVLHEPLTARLLVALGAVCVGLLAVNRR